MRRVIGLALFGTLILVFATSHMVVGKGHVPAKKSQVCHNGEVVTLSNNAVDGHLVHGDCILPLCDFANVFHTGDACNGSTSDSDDHCTSGLAARSDAGGITPGCPAGKF